MKVYLLESKGYKLSRPETDEHGSDVYRFQRSNGLGGKIRFRKGVAKGHEGSEVSWAVQHKHGDDYHHAPDEDSKASNHKDLSKILKSVRVAVDHHLRTKNPGVLHYGSSRDAKDYASHKSKAKHSGKSVLATPGTVKNRKLSLYHRVVAPTMKKRGYKLVHTSDVYHVWSKS